MPISSLIVQVHHGGLEQTKSHIDADPRLEITDVLNESVVVLTETRDREEDFAIWRSLQSLHEVECVSLIYHNHEDLEAPGVSIQST